MATKESAKATTAKTSHAKKAKATKGRPDEVSVVKHSKISSEALPRRTLEQAVALAQKLYEVYARETASESEIAQALGFSGVTNHFRYQLWAALGYGIVTKDADGRFLISETGRKIVAETFEGEAKEGRIKAIMTPTVLSKFYSTYNGHAIPASNHLANLLESRFEVPRDRTAEAIDLIMENARYASILEPGSSEDTHIIRLTGAFEGTPEGSGDPSTDVAADKGPVQIGDEWEKICFYVTPIGDEGTEERKHADLMLKHLLTPVFKELNLTVVRADAITRSGIITQQVFEHLAKARICIADLSFSNPNAFYELGVRHVCQMPTIQIIRKGDKIPFDVSQGRTIIIDTTDRYTLIDRIESAKRELTEHAKNALSSGDSGNEDNPVSVYLPGLKVKLP
jgi:antitoxin component of MazEF toxin-antitoxin module